MSASSPGTETRQMNASVTARTGEYMDRVKYFNPGATMTADIARNVRRHIVELESQTSPISIKGSRTDVTESYGTLPVAFGLASWKVAPAQVQ